MSNAQFSNLPRLHAPLQLLQVFNNGQPSGWLGKSVDSYWFHYGDNNPHQNWVSLLMPPSTNFYQQSELFQVFAQHLPTKSLQEITRQQYPGIELGQLDFLYLFNANHLGCISFANPDSPVVRPVNNIAPEALVNMSFNDLLKQYAPCSMPGNLNNFAILVSTQSKKQFTDTLVYSAHAWALVQNLASIKKDIDPSNRLQALRWTMNARKMPHLTCCQRPDLDLYHQRLLGLEHVSSLLNMSSHSYTGFTISDRHIPVLQEIARTYCKHFSLEIKFLLALSPLLKAGTVTPFLIYTPQRANLKTKVTTILGLEYLLT